MAVFSQEVLTQVYEDAPFWWYLKDQATNSPLYRRSQIEELDERLNAFLHMLVLADKAGHQPLENIPLQTPGGLFIHVWLGILQEYQAIWQDAVATVNDVELSDELASALSYFNARDIKDVLSFLGFSDNLWLRRATLKYAQLQQVRLADNYLQTKIEGTDEPEVLMALENIGCQSHATQFDTSTIQVESEAIDFAKLKIRYCHGIEAASQLIPDMKTWIHTQSPFIRSILPMLFSIAPITDIVTWVEQLLAASISERLKLYAVGVAGLPKFIPTLMTYMDDPEWAPLAAEALTMITGVDIEEADLSLMEVRFQDTDKQSRYRELEEETWNQRYQRDNQTQRYELELPYPDVALVKQWWMTEQSNWPLLTRYVAGQLPDVNGLNTVLQKGNQQQRAHAALYLKHLQPTNPKVNVLVH